MVFKKGSLIANSKPFAYVIVDSKRGQRCEACLQLNQNLLRCTGCKFAQYCNKNCQMQGWILHKLECKHLKRAHPNVPPDMSRLMALIILKLKLKDGNNEEEKIANVSRKYSCLVDHVEDLKMDKERFGKFLITRNILGKYLGQDLLPPVSELLIHFGKLMVNSFTITDVDLQQIGVGQYLGASGLDHSCKPNATIVFYGPDMQIRALEDIDHSDITKITVTYIDLFTTTSSRREVLRKTYYFTCNCALCNDHDRDVSLNSVRCGNVSCTRSIDPCAENKVCSCGKEMDADAAKKAFVAFESFLETNNIGGSKINILFFENIDTNAKYIIHLHWPFELHEETLKKCKSLLRNCSRYLHPLNFRLVQVWTLAMDACIELQMWESAWEYGKNILPAYRLYIGNAHQIIAIHLLKIAHIQLNLGNARLKAVKTLAECFQILRLTHEESHPIFGILRCLREKC